MAAFIVSKTASKYIRGTKITSVSYNIKTACLIFPDIVSVPVIVFITWWCTLVPSIDIRSFESRSVSWIRFWGDWRPGQTFFATPSRLEENVFVVHVKVTWILKPGDKNSQQNIIHSTACGCNIVADWCRSSSVTAHSVLLSDSTNAISFHTCCLCTSCARWW